MYVLISNGVYFFGVVENRVIKFNMVLFARFPPFDIGAESLQLFFAGILQIPMISRPKVAF